MPPTPRPPAAARKFANRFEGKYPPAVAYLRNDLYELLTCEVRRTRPMGTFQDMTMDRILFVVFTHENKSQGVGTPFHSRFSCSPTTSKPLIPNDYDRTSESSHDLLRPRCVRKNWRWRRTK
jgi:hypothetical protein